MVKKRGKGKSLRRRAIGSGHKQHKKKVPFGLTTSHRVPYHSQSSTIGRVKAKSNYVLVRPTYQSIGRRVNSVAKNVRKNLLEFNSTMGNYTKAYNDATNLVHDLVQTGREVYKVAKPLLGLVAGGKKTRKLAIGN
jgi:hypothetical protein